MPYDNLFDGEGGSLPPIPTQQSLRVDPEAIPHLRNVFSTALVKLDKQIELAITEVRVRPWAGDPVSAEAATKFNERSFDAADSALTALQGYQAQLKSALDALGQVERQYHVVEGDNTDLLKQGGC
ncbi:transcriptional regulator [Solihabitans fulvus]|uniref:Transcriptional regulator n=1 Tax=Solihabitans fulvus TaxID=1892852 RepID=A0A5B2WL39_9PSEU|nr:transcriptional regulator [Solihabitans fulvus]KAA2251216.1 transcriptional regulator [Solihabitans fulvus]